MSEKKSAAPISSVPDERQSQLKLLIAKGKEQGFLTYGEVNDHLPSEIVDPEQIEDIVNMINDMGIPVYEKAPDAESLILADGPVATDDEAVAMVHKVARTEGILVALETAHAFARIADVAARERDRRGRPARVLVTLSGRGDKDLATLTSYEEPRRVAH